jgi:hypothetical protein
MQLLLMANADDSCGRHGLSWKAVLALYADLLDANVQSIGMVRRSRNAGPAADAAAASLPLCQL